MTSNYNNDPKKPVRPLGYKNPGTEPEYCANPKCRGWIKQGVAFIRMDNNIYHVHCAPIVKNT